MRYPEVNKNNVVDFFIALKDSDAIVDAAEDNIIVILKSPLKINAGICKKVSEDSDTYIVYVDWQRFSPDDSKARALYTKEDGTYVCYNSYRWVFNIDKATYKLILHILQSSKSMEEKKYLEEDAKILNTFIYGKE